MAASGTVTKNDNGTVKFITHCTWCDKPSALDQLDPEALRAYLAREAAVQELFPQMSASEREVLISGTHGECWEAMFGGGGE